MPFRSAIRGTAIWCSAAHYLCSAAHSFGSDLLDYYEAVRRIGIRPPPAWRAASASSRPFNQHRAHPALRAPPSLLATHCGLPYVLALRFASVALSRWQVESTGHRVGSPVRLRPRTRATRRVCPWCAAKHSIVRHSACRGA